MEIITELTINLTRGRTIQNVIKSSKYDEINYLVANGVQRGRLSLMNEISGERKLVILGSNEDVSSNDVLTEARDLGLVRPSYGDAFLTGEQHPDEQVAGPIVFLHEPQYSWSGNSFNLVLDSNRTKRVISFVSSGGWWHCRFRFALRRK